MAVSRKGIATIVRAFRPIVVRIIRAYRTKSHTAVLAGMPPIELMALEYARAYREQKALKERGVALTLATRT